ncbi:hypothetical protein [Winogradskyella pulchriflava]|uniref:Uncharacterized protein n=1 Tax=Winogradskyella pulchriflava TaxID=1110688 RepID=A0ABV6QB68_9FLAO
MEEPNKPRLYFFIKAPIVIVSIIVFVNDYNTLVEYLNLSGSEKGLLDYLKAGFNTTILRTSLIMLIPLIGVFINRKIGWILILCFYYFWIILFIYSTLSTELDRSGSIVIACGVIIISLFFIGLMNSNENRKLVYGIEKNEQLKLNIVSCIIAIIAILLIIFFNFTRTY